MPHTLTKGKARKILKHGEVRGKALSSKQKGFFGARAGGKKPKSGRLSKFLRSAK